MKILIINYEFPPLGGGGGIASYDLALEWAKTGRVDVLTSHYGDLKKYEEHHGLRIYRVPVLFRKSRDAATFLSMLTYIPAALIKGACLILKNRYDVINTHFAVPSGPVGYLLGLMLRVPNVLSLHGGDIYDPSKKMSPHRNPFFKRVVCFILNRANRLVAQSSNTRDNAIKYYKPRQNIDIIPLAFHPPKKTGLTRKDFSITKNEFVIVCLGRLVKRKAIDVLISALSKIEDLNMSLYILGDGPEKEALKDLAKSLKVADRVHFLGYVDDDDVKYAHLGIADIFALPSMHEGFGIVFMEAMEMGLPIVTTNHGGQTDFLEHEENALLINVGDSESCAMALKRFKNDKKLYSFCSKNNRAKIKEFYAEKVAERYTRLFSEVIERYNE